MNDDYPLMAFPESFESFKTMGKPQAQRYFDWYLGQAEGRIDQLRRYARDTGGASLAWDHSPESLVPLWEWFEPHITMEEKSEAEYRAELARVPDWLRDSVPREGFSVRTLALITDISFYFAETFLRNNPTVRWGFFTKPKNEVSVNLPVLMGFKGNMKLDPRRIVQVCAQKSQRERDKNRLFDIYRVWLDYIEP